MKKVFLKVAWNELLKHETQVTGCSKHLPEILREDREFKPGITRFVTWYLADSSGKIISENISYVDEEKMLFKLPSSLNMRNLTGCYNIRFSNPENSVYFEVDLIPAPAGTM